MGPLMPVDIGGYKYVSKVTDEYTKWTTVYLMTNKNQSLQSLHLFVGSTITPFGGRIVRWRADKGGEYTGEEARQYCLKTGTIQKFAATSTQQQTRTRGEDSVRHSTVHNRRQWLLVVHVGELFLAAAYIKNRTRYKALKMETPFKMLHGEKANLSHLRVIEARTFVYIKDSKNLDDAA